MTLAITVVVTFLMSYVCVIAEKQQSKIFTVYEGAVFNRVAVYRMKTAGDMVCRERESTVSTNR